MKMFENYLRYTLFMIIPLLMSSIAIAQDDEFDIVVVSDSKGAHSGESICSKILKITKSPSTPTPKYIVASAEVSSFNGTTSQEVLIEDIDDFFDFYLGSPIPVFVEHGYISFPGLLSGHQGGTTIAYTIEIHMENSIVVEEFSIFELVPSYCMLTGEIRVDSQQKAPIQNLNVFPTQCNTYQDILFELTQDANVSIGVFDMQGRQCMSVSSQYQTKGQHFVYVNTSELVNGTYFYKIQVDEWSTTSKFVKLN